MENWSRPYWQEYSQNPHLFYGVLGKFELTDELKQLATDLPQSVECNLMEGGYFRDNFVWELFKRDNPELAAVAAQAPDTIILVGEIHRQRDLDYLKSCVDLTTYLTENGGTTVFDPHTISWFSAEDWQHRAEDGQIFNPFDHVILLISEEPEGLWLHTRGLRKFGRPELSVRGVGAEEEGMVKKMLDRFISFQALGGVIEEGREVTMKGLEGLYVPGAVQGSVDDPDFNNFHVEIVKRG